jgi:hypothetical protein
LRAGFSQAREAFLAGVTYWKAFLFGFSLKKAFEITTEYLRKGYNILDILGLTTNVSL